MGIFKENLTKGKEFEKYVKTLFSPQHFIINDRNQKDLTKLRTKVKSDDNPDITIRYIKTLKLFSVECKFRSQIHNNSIHWASPNHIQNYQNYESMYKIPTFIVIGLGGTPTKPEKMFCLPLKKAKYPNLYISFLDQYERKPDKMFFWRNGSLE